MRKRTFVIILMLVMIIGTFSGCTDSLSDYEIKEQIKKSTPISLNIKTCTGTEIYLIGGHNSSNPVALFTVEIDWLSSLVLFAFSLECSPLNEILPETIQNITSKISIGGWGVNKWDDEFILYNNGQFSKFTTPIGRDGAVISVPFWMEIKDTVVYFLHEPFCLYWTEADRNTGYIESIKFDFCYYNVELVSQLDWEIPSGYNMTIDAQWIEDYFSEATTDQLNGWYKVKAHLDHAMDPWLGHDVMLWYNINSLETKMVCA